MRPGVRKLTVETSGVAQAVTAALLFGLSAPFVFAAMALGFVSYGVSVALAVRAMRALGAARQSAFFATAPFIGALAAVPILGEGFRPGAITAGSLMVLGVVLLITEVHQHWHEHELLEHEHEHIHDEHHLHEHAETGLGAEPHAHAHVHPPLSHAHPHVSDVHHRHRH